MTLEQLGSLGEVAGAVATIATLLFLALQIRQNTKMVRSAAISSHAQNVGGVSALLAGDQELCDLYYKGMESPDLLTRSERNRFYTALGTFMMYLQQSDQMASEGTLPQDLAHQYNVQLDWVVCQPGFQLWFEHWGDTLPDGFQKKIDGAMARGKAAGRFGISTAGRTRAGTEVREKTHRPGNIIHTGAIDCDVAAREAEVVGTGPRIEPPTADVINSYGDRPLRELGDAIGRGDEEYQMPEAVATMMRHPDLFRCQLALSVQLAANGALTPRERELVVLRVTWLCRAPYAWSQHVANARQAGITDDEIERVTQGSSAPGWSEHERALLMAVEELLGDQSIADATWNVLSRSWSEQQFIELPVLVGTYYMFALQQNSIKVRLPAGNNGLRQR